MDIRRALKTSVRNWKDGLCGTNFFVNERRENRFLENDYCIIKPEDTACG